MDPGKRRTLIDWVNSLGVDEQIEDLTQLKEGVAITKIINCMQSAPDGTSTYTLPLSQPWDSVKAFLSGTCLADEASNIEWGIVESGAEFEIAKVVLLLVSMTVGCPNKDKLIEKMTDFDAETQYNLRDILMAALNENANTRQHVFDLLTQKALMNEQYDDSIVDSRNASVVIATPPTNSPADSPIKTVHDRLVHAANCGASFRTPVKQIFRRVEEEEVFVSVPTSCPPHRRGNRPGVSFHDLHSFNTSHEYSPMREFLSSPVVSYKMKIRDMDQKINILEKNLEAERQQKEDCIKALTQKEAATQDLERKVRNLYRSSVQTQQLYDELDEFTATKLERDSLARENSKLKHRLEKYDVCSSEIKDLKRDLEEKSRENDELSQRAASLKNSLEKITNENLRAEQLNESVISLQEKNNAQEQDINHLYTMLHQLKTQIVEQKEVYEEKIREYKSMIEDKDSSGIENHGESMGILMEHRVLELQETIQEMEKSWTKPDAVAKLKADLNVAKETVEQYQVKVQMLTSEKISLEEDACRLHRDLSTKTGEAMDAMKNLAAANQKLKHLEAAAEVANAQIEMLAGDKESLKRRVQDLQADVLELNIKVSKYEMELSVSRNENKNNAVALESHARRVSDSDQKIADFEQRCRFLSDEIVEKSREIDALKNFHESKVESFENATAIDKERISGLEDRMRILEREKEAAASETLELRENLLQKKQSLLDACEEAESLKLKIKTYDSSCSELEAKFSDLKVKMEDSNATFEKKLTFKQEEIERLLEEGAVSKSSIIFLEEQCKKTKEDLDVAAEGFRIASENLLQASSEKKGLEMEKNKLEEEAEKGQKQLRDSLASQESLENAFEAAKVELESEKKNLELLIKERENEIHCLKVAVSREKERGSDLESESNGYKNLLNVKMDELKEMQLRMRQQEEEYQAKLGDNKDTLAEKDDEYSSLRLAFEEKDFKCKEFEKMNEDIELVKAQLEKNALIYQEENALMKASLSEAESRIQEQEDVIKKVQKENTSKREMLEEDVSNTQGEIKSLKVLLEEKEAINTESLVDELEMMKVENVRLLKRSDDRKREVDELGAAVRALEECKVSEAKRVVEFGEAEKKLQEEVLTVKKELESKREETNMLRDKLKMMEKQIEIDMVARDETVADLILVKTEVESSEKSHTEVLMTLNTNIQVLEEKLGNSERERESLDGKIENLVRTYTNVLEDLRSECDGIRDSRDQALRDIEDLNKMLELSENQARTKIDALKQDNEKIVEGLSELHSVKNEEKMKMHESELKDVRQTCEYLAAENESLKKVKDSLEEKLKENLTCLESELKRVQEERLEFMDRAEFASEQKENAEEKLKAIRAQFTEKYRKKQEKILDLEQNLNDWQARADEQTHKYDEMAAMYDEKRTLLSETTQNLNQVREENLDLQEAARNLKAENAMLTSNKSQFSVKKIEEEKKIRALSAEVQRLQTQLQHAERQIRENRTSVRPRYSLWGSQPLTTVKEAVTPRRRSLDISAHDVLSDDNLFRCRSDTFLDSPVTANKKVRRQQQEQRLDDSLEDILKTPGSLQTGNRSEAALSDTFGARARSNLSLGIETSLLDDSSGRIDVHSRGQSMPQLSTNRSINESADASVNSASLTEVNSFTAGSETRRRSFDAHKYPGSLAFETEEEPEDYEWGSLSRIAELQRRNAATLPHLQSSYPVETQGQTPSKSDESVRIGNADKTLRRMTQIPSALQRPLAAEAGPLRRLTLDVHGERHWLDREADIHRTGYYASSDSLQFKGKGAATNTTRDEAQRKSSRGLPTQRNPDHNRWRDEILSQEDKEQVDPTLPDRRMSFAFEIPNSPKPLAMRSRASRKTATSKSVQDENVPGASKRASFIAKTPDRSKNTKGNVGEKRRTPSLMDRVKRPLSRFNKK